MEQSHTVNADLHKTEFHRLSLQGVLDEHSPHGVAFKVMKIILVELQ